MIRNLLTALCFILPAIAQTPAAPAPPPLTADSIQHPDFHFSFGVGPHNVVEGAAEFPQELIWLWRDYDPAQTRQTYTQDTAEATRPPFRASITNRDTH